MRRLLILTAVVGIFLIRPLAAQNCTDNVTWTGAVNTDWNTAGNWSPARVPTQSDTATIPLGKTVTNQPGAGLGTGFICSLTLDGTLTIDTSALILLSTTVASTLNNLTLTAAQGISGLTIAGSATFNGNLVLNPGQVGGAGTATINGTVKVSKGPSFLTTATVNNEGSIAVTQDGVQLTLGAGVFNNDGPIDLQGDGIALVGGGTFENSGFGSISKSKGPGASSFSSISQFSTAGTVSGQTGTLVFSASGTSTGAFNADGTLQFTNRVTMNAGTTIGGAGTIDIVAGGVWDVETPLTVNSSQLIFDGAAGNLILGNSDVTINSLVAWNGGWLGTSGGSAKVTFTKNVTIATSTSHASFRTLDIFATVTMNADLSMNAPNATAPAITIEPGATFNIGTDNGIHGQCTINNNGTFTKTGGAQVSRLDYSGNFNTLTTVAVSSGTLNLVIIGGGTLAADLSANTGATLEFSNGSYAVMQGTVFSGSGTTLLTGQAIWTAGGTTSVNSAVFEFDSGQINGTGNLTINSPNFMWTGGSMQGAGITNLAGGATTIKEGGVRVIGRTINNFHRTVLLDDAAKVFLADATWNNEPGSSLVFQTDGNIADGASGPSTFNNSGIVHKEGGMFSTVAFNGTFNNNDGAQVSTSAHSLLLQSSQGTSAGAFIAQGDVHNAVTFGGFNGRGIWSINSGTTMTGNGSIAISNATWNLTTPLQVQTQGFSSANPSIIMGASDLTLGSRYIVLNGRRTGGPIKIPNSTTQASVGDLSLDACRLDNSGEVTINPHSNGGGMILTNGSALLNEAGGMVVLARQSIANDPVMQISGDSAVSNLGTMTLDTDRSNLAQQIQGVGGTAVGQFNNSKLVEVPAGHTLIISVGKGTSQGSYTADGTLAFQDGIFTLASGTVLNGSGTLNLGGTFQVSSNTTLSTPIFQFGPQHSSNGLTGGVIQGVGTLMIASSQANCDAGTIAMSFPGLVSFSPQTVVTNSSTGSCTTLGSRLFNAGTINLDKGSFSLGGGATLNNLPGGTINLQGTTGIHDGGGPGNFLNNQGTVLEGGSANTIDFTGSFNNSGNLTTQGSLTFGLATNYIQTKGSTTVDGGTISADSPLEIDGGSVGGNGTIKAKVNNPGGTLGAGSQTTPGTLNLTQPETQGPNSTLYELIAEALRPQVYDQINSTSSMTAGGTLRFQFGHGFTPAPTTSFNILTFASGSGTFSRVITPSPTCKAVLVPTTKALNVKFTSTNVSVTINPPTVTLHENQQQQFTDTVSNGCGNGVTWSVKESGGGTIDQTGLYTAPARTGTFHVVVTSIADPSKFAFSTVTVIAARNQLAVTPPAALLQPGKTLLLRANRSVVWSIAEGKSGGSVSMGGRYTAPLKPGLYHVVATSTADLSLHATANIAVVGAKLKFAYVANIDKDSISVLAPGSDGASANTLHETASVVAGQKPVALALSPNGKFLFSVNADSNDLSVFALSLTSGTLRAVAGASSASGNQPHALAFDPSGRFAFVTNRGSDDISIFSADASGRLTFLDSHALAAGEAPGTIAAHPNGALVFAASTGSHLIHGFTFTAGSVKEIAGSPFDAGTAPAALAMDPSGQFLFVANRDSGDVSVFDIDAKNETLRQVSGSPFQAGKAPSALALDLTGSYLFVADHDSNDVTTFQIDVETGALTRFGRTLLPAPGPSALAMDPSGQSLFVASDQSTGMTTLTLDIATGMLTPTGKTQGRAKASSIVLVGNSTEKP